MSNKILVVVTNHSKYPSLERATGAWLGEIVHFANPLLAAGYELDFVSPKGGYVPMDPHSLTLADAQDWQWYQNPELMRALGNTLSPEQVDASQYQAIYYAGGHGVMWDFVDQPQLQRIAEQIYARGGWVSAVCHGVVVLLNLKQGEQWLLAGKQVTGFSDEEEQQLQLTEHVPFLTEQALRARGGLFQATEAWHPWVVSDQRLITGQNPGSTALVAQQLLQELQGASLS